MTRRELYDKITPCGDLSYTDMVYLLESLSFADVQIKYLLINRISQTGKLSQQDWILLAKSINFVAGSPIDANTVIGWLTGKCSLSMLELKAFLEYVTFTDGSTPTYILSQTGDFIIAE